MIFGLYHEQGLREDVMDLLVVLHLQPDDVRGRRGGSSSGGRCGPPGRWLAGPHSWSAVFLGRLRELHGATATATQIYTAKSVKQYSLFDQQCPQISGPSPAVEGY